ncbi:MAG: ubiquinol-cytochrome c reductase iron-sulfur subunit [Anaerolineaceae bacterium]|nr:ubiquinol-cytochrome c reductase iron-sulfur subunit [Anaerolineaceae bacterium]
MASARAVEAINQTPETTTDEIPVNPPSRREFLFYIWGASMLMILGQSSVGMIWFMWPLFKEGEFGGVFKLDQTVVPSAGDAPNSFPEGRFHLTHPERGLLALYNVCTHLGCLPKWQGARGRFECPCHGSKYELDGTWIEGPAPRSLDRFEMTITFLDGSKSTTNLTGDPIDLTGRSADDISLIEINTSKRIKRAGRT